MGSGGGGGGMGCMSSIIRPGLGLALGGLGWQIVSQA